MKYTHFIISEMFLCKFSFFYDQLEENFDRNLKRKVWGGETSFISDFLLGIDYVSSLSYPHTCIIYLSKILNFDVFDLKWLNQDSVSCTQTIFLTEIICLLNVAIRYNGLGGESYLTVFLKLK